MAVLSAEKTAAIDTVIEQMRVYLTHFAGLNYYGNVNFTVSLQKGLPHAARRGIEESMTIPRRR